MSIIGKTLGHYKIGDQPLGKGGMGEVYRAKDLKLGRDVAIKVLPEEFARDADRVSRFQREAKLLASLNHPNIAAIYGLEESGGIQFLVLELVEGETLADQLKRGPIPVEESLKLALQIAEALEAAHEKGVIHRDLKPANIKVTPDGKVKVLDFGLAKAFAGDQTDLNLSNSPTLSNTATQQGVILGTAAYMSPEQARGKSVDKRADIWAFGCVLYEMLTGQAAFQGEDITEILASVVKGGANLDLIPGNIHPRVRELLAHCLQKDLKKRYQDIGDVRFELEQVVAAPNGVLVKPMAAAEIQSSRFRPAFWRVVTAIVLTAIVTGMVIWVFRPTPSRPLITRFAIDLEGPLNDVDAIALSPDGRRLVYSANSRLYSHVMDQMEPTPIPGTEQGSNPFFSPDGESVAFFTPTQLKRASLAGGIPVVVAEVGPASGLVGTWDPQDRIFFGQNGSFGLSQVLATGGTPKSFAQLGGHNDFDYPEVLPGGKWVLFTDQVTGTRWSNANIVAQSVATGERKIVLKGGHFARYAPTGHLVYAQNGTLFAVGFDANRVEVTGTAVPLVQNVATSELSGHAKFALARNGTLVYVPGTTDTGTRRTLVWVDRKGKEEPLKAPPNGYFHPRISPDGTRVALSIETGGNANIWIWNLTRETLTRLTFDAAVDTFPLWFLDGKRIAFASNRDSNYSVYWKASDGTGKDEQLGSMPGREIYPSSWSGDGKLLVLEESSGGSGGYDIGGLSMEGDRKWRLVLKEEFTLANAQISADGRWMAYLSNESGQIEIYVRPFPNVNSGKWQVSTSGGQEPRWSRDGRELFYRNGNSMMAVAIETEPTFKAGKPKALFTGTYFSLRGHMWDLSPDGKQFLMVKPNEATASAAGAPKPRINIVLNWFEELKQRVPVK